MPFPADPARSTQYQAQLINNDKVDYRNLSPVLRMLDIMYTHGEGDQADADGQGEIQLIALPVEGMEIKIWPHMCLLAHSQFAAASTMSIGLREYYTFEGVQVPEDPDFFFLNVDTAAAALDDTLWTGVTGVQVDNTPIPIQIAGPGLDGVYRTSEESMLRIFATIAGGNIEIGDTINLRMAVGYGA